MGLRHFNLITIYISAFGFPYGAEVTINGAELHQSIDGFGASPKFGDGGRRDLFFSRETGIGLSLCRTPIPPDGSFPNLDIAKAAQAHGAKVWSTSWSPPAHMKSNKRVNDGGYLLPEHYQDFAEFLADFSDTAKANGINLYAISVQNEPEVTAAYMSCLWNARQFHDFIRNNLGPTFKRRSIRTKIVAPEYAGWNFDLAEPSMDDSVSRNFLSILAAHTYKPLDKSIPYRKALEYGKRQWQTEVSDLKPIDRSMDNALRWVQEIHTMLTKTRINAWHYWLLDGSTKNNNEGLWAQGSTKRLYALGNYAKFARPGFVLVGTASSSADLLVSAFKDTAASGKIAIVAANRSAIDVSCTFTLNQSGVKTLTPWETSGRSDLARNADIPVKDGRFTINLPAKSITTFDGTEPAAIRISIRPAGARMSGAGNGIRILENGMVFLGGSAWGPDRAVRLDGRAPNLRENSRHGMPPKPVSE